MQTVKRQSLSAKNKAILPTYPPEKILKLVADIDTEAQLTKLGQLAVQGRWLEWTDVMACDLSWRKLIHGLDDGELRFTIQAITNTTPTPDNLRRWGQKDIDPACALCERPCTLRHISSQLRFDILITPTRQIYLET